jgi:hypothetical protein|tara:strand:+ start:231 stop:377 length:147 start_codon:yes stop_codon:yes gene_type:complete
MNIQYKDAILLHAVVVLIVVVIRDQTVLPLDKYSKSNMMSSTIQINHV